MKTICVTRLFGLLCGISSMNALTNKLKNVNKDFNDIISIDKGSNIENYYLVKDYIYNKYKFNIVRYIEKSPPNSNKNTKIFTYITNLFVDDNDIQFAIDKDSINSDNSSFIIDIVCMILLFLLLIIVIIFVKRKNRVNM